MEECLLYKDAVIRHRPTPCHRKVRCGLQRGASMLLGKQYGVEQWMVCLENQDAFHGFPGWVMGQAWGYFTPLEQVVLERWRRMHDVMLARQWKRDQAQRDKPRRVR
jgi:hypothetical protein